MEVNKTSVEGLVKYCQSIADEFRARQDRISNFVKHNLTSGTARETILRDFLAEHSTGHYKVVQGFICDPTKPDQVSRQCDILVYNHLYHPVVHSEGQIKIVWPISVRMTIEVKTKLNKNSLHKALENVGVAKKLNYMMTGLVFAFKSISIEKIVEHLKCYPDPLNMKYAPNAILVLDKKLVVASDNLWTATTEQTAYKVWKAYDEGVLMTFLFLTFLANVTEPSLMTTALNAARILLVERAKLLSDCVTIGSDRTLQM